MEVHGVVISGVISPLIWVIIIVTLLITPVITTPEPPSIGFTGFGVLGSWILFHQHYP